MDEEPKKKKKKFQGKRSISRLYNHNQGKLEHLKEQHVFSCGLIKLKHRQVRCLHGLIAASQLQSCKLEKEHECQAGGELGQSLTSITITDCDHVKCQSGGRLLSRMHVAQL